MRPRTMSPMWWPVKNCSHTRSEEHTSELQSHSDLVCRLLLEKKNRNQKSLEHPTHGTGRRRSRVDGRFLGQRSRRSRRRREDGDENEWRIRHLRKPTSERREV